MRDVAERMVDCMKQGWKSVVPEFSVVIHHVDTNPQFVNATHPDDMSVLVTTEVKIGNIEGMMNICYPYSCLSGIMERLSTQFWYSGDKVLANCRKYKFTGLMDIPVEITAEIYRKAYPLQTILNWKKEELLLPLASRMPSACFLRFGNRRVFGCSMVVDEKWLPKKVLIENVAENPHKTEGIMETIAINPLVAGALASANITISVELGRTVKTINEVLKLTEGDIVELDKLAGEPADIKANGVLIGRGEVVVIGENFGIRIVDIAGAFGQQGGNPNEDEAAK
jgi:flagellar motor switch protein FliN